MKTDTPTYAMLADMRDRALIAERELAAVTEQRDAVTLRLGNTQERMIDAERQRDKLAEAVNAATVLIAAKGRHNTMLAYEGLRSALSPKNAGGMARELAAQDSKSTTDING
jgi:hypothetical protein